MPEKIDTEKIKKAFDLRELAGRYTTLQNETGQEQSGPCPKCGGDDRFHVAADWCFCRQCWPYDNGEAHDAIALVQWLGLASNFRGACEWLAGPGAIPSGSARKRTAEPKGKRQKWKTKQWQDAARRELAEAQQRLETAPGEAGRAYLIGRGILAETWRAWGLGYGPAWDGTAKRERPAVVIPWQRNLLSALKFRFTDSAPGGMRFTSKGGSECIACGLQLAGIHKQTLWLIEGEFNAISLWQALRGVGCVNFDVVSFGGEGKARNIDPVILRVAGQYQQVIVWADKPNLSRAAMAAIPGAFGLRSPEHDGGKLDANDLLQRGILADFARLAWDRFDGRQ